MSKLLSRPDAPRPARRSLFGRFLKSRRGNIGVTATILAGPLIGMMGGAVDLMHFATVRAELQGALDSGTLAAASLSNSRDTQDVIEEYLAVNLDKGLVNPDLVRVTTTTTRALNRATVTIRAEYDISTVFLGLFGIKDLPVVVEVGGEQSVQEVEISLVLDISSSMKGAKLTNLKDAAEEFIDTVLDEDVIDVTSVNLVPFGGTVRLPSEFDGYVDPTEAADYAGCLEFDHFDPFNFALDGDDYDYEYPVITGASTQLTNTEINELGGNQKAGSHNDDKHQSVPHSYKWNNKNPWCPKDTTTAMFLSNDPDDLKDAIDDMELSDGTGMDIGAMVGLLALDPAWRGKLGGDFPSRPVDFNGETLKVLIIMTDGEITSQLRPKAEDLVEGSLNMTKINGKEWALQDKKNQRVRIKTSEAEDHFLDVCQAAKDDNILIFTIGFEIQTNKWSHTALGQCPQNENQYYWVEGLDISTAFNSIAASINNLRLTK